MALSKSENLTPHIVSDPDGEPILVVVASNEAQAAAMILDSLRANGVDDGEISEFINTGWPAAEHIRKVDTSRRHAIMISGNDQ